VVVVELDVEVVGGGFGCVVVVVVVEWVVAVDEVVAVVTVAVAVVAVGVLTVRQSLTASSWTVEAPWLRLARNVLLTVSGRFATTVPKPWLADAAAPQLCADTAEEI
jgi:hypothetical protein